MIQNERQRYATLVQIERLKGALEASRGAKGKVDDRIYRAMIAGIEGMIEEMRQELREYEELKAATGLHIGATEELPQVLIKARIARGYTQKELAERLGLQPQQIQRYEATGYRSASLKRLLEVMKALDLKLEADIPLRPAPNAAKEEVAVGEKVEPYGRKRRRP
ncbi:MAG TPA: helix-turn-helix transcriptional regulator [Planctomycetota bacterium]|nr:helix-turn-helix transcriptional regulator [Planctomycetota bacterium]